MNKLRHHSIEIVFFGYLFIALQTFGYTFHRWNETYYSFSSTTATPVKYYLTNADRTFFSLVSASVWPLYWTVRLYEPN